ncbi:MAG: MBOAT family protein [Clostridium sp.]|nr:MBOAT family protein [Acetatifactor muris]MCM1527548.1 hypothetical protein [Bacteroides sp.]MCM1563790.1 MBOAT family protein [Clostridium sp.]
MVFSSLEFLLYFFPIFFILYGLTPDRHKNLTLLAGSLVFYALGERGYLWLLVVSVAVNYCVGCFVGADIKFKKIQTLVWYLAMAGNVGILLAFKMPMRQAAIPLGLSFYTFRILSRLIDIRRGEVRADRSFVRFATYVTMFPQMISGPLTDYGEVSADLSHRRMSARSIQNGLKLFTLGLAAKVLLADKVGLLWNDVQVRGIESVSTPLAWMGAIAYSLKIYFDFAGYSLMAAGLGAMMGFHVPENFRTPYMARSVRDFYRRWHITLGQWFRKYVYIPLGGNRRGELCTVRNLLIVWALTALWHGGRGNFLIWGMLIWILIVLERQVQSLRERRHPKETVGAGLQLLSRLYLWIVIPITWMCFAITDVGELGTYLGRMFGAAPVGVVMANDWRAAWDRFGVLLLICGLSCTSLVRKVFHRWKDSLIGSVVLAVLFWLCVRCILLEGDNPFLYSNF